MPLQITLQEIKGNSQQKYRLETYSKDDTPLQKHWHTLASI